MWSPTHEGKSIKTANVGTKGEGCERVADGMPLLSKEQGISAPSDPLNGCILPANMTNADEADKIHMLILRKKKPSIILFHGTNPIKQRLHTEVPLMGKLHTNQMKNQSREQFQVSLKDDELFGLALCRSGSKDKGKDV